MDSHIRLRPAGRQRALLICALGCALLAASCSDAAAPAPAERAESSPYEIAPAAPSQPASTEPAPAPPAAPREDDAGVADDLEKGGDVMVRRGDMAGAAQRYAGSVRVTQGLVEQHPEDAKLQEALARRLERAAYSFQLLGDADRAVKHYRDHVVLAGRLAARDRDSAHFAYDALRSLQAIGDLDLQRGRPADALKSYQAALDLSQRMSDGAPDDRAAKTNLSIAFGRVGFAHQRAGELDAALENLQRAERIASALAHGAASDAPAQRDWAASLLELANVEELKGDLDTAIGHLDTALSLWRKQAATATLEEGPAVMHQLSVAAARLARPLSRRGDAVRAESLARESLAILLDLVPQASDPVVAARETCARHELLADVLLAAGRAEEAATCRRRSLAVLDELDRQEESSPVIQFERAQIHERIARDRDRAGDTEGARASRARALELARLAAQADASLGRAAEALVARIAEFEGASAPPR